MAGVCDHAHQVAFPQFLNFLPGTDVYFRLPKLVRPNTLT